MKHSVIKEERDRDLGNYEVTMKNEIKFQNYLFPEKAYILNKTDESVEINGEEYYHGFSNIQYVDEKGKKFDLLKFETEYACPSTCKLENIDMFIKKVLKIQKNKNNKDISMEKLKENLGSYFFYQILQPNCNLVTDQFWEDIEEDEDEDEDEEEEQDQFIPKQVNINFNSDKVLKNLYKNDQEAKQLQYQDQKLEYPQITLFMTQIINLIQETLQKQQYDQVKLKLLSNILEIGQNVIEKLQIEIDEIEVNQVYSQLDDGKMNDQQLFDMFKVSMKEKVKQNTYFSEIQVDGSDHYEIIKEYKNKFMPQNSFILHNMNFKVNHDDDIQNGYNNIIFVNDKKEELILQSYIMEEDKLDSNIKQPQYNKNYVNVKNLNKFIKNELKLDRFIKSGSLNVGKMFDNLQDYLMELQRLNFQEELKNMEECK